MTSKSDHDEDVENGESCTDRTEKRVFRTIYRKLGGRTKST